MDRLSAEIVEIGAGEILDDGLRKVTAIRWNTHWNVMAIVLKNMINRCIKCPGIKSCWRAAWPTVSELKAGKTITLEDGRQINGADT